MENLKKLLEEDLNAGLLRITLSGRRAQDAPQKVKIRPLLQKGRLVFQAALWDGKKELHRNYEKEEMISEILAWMSRDFGQMQMSTTARDATVLVSRKGKVTIRVRKCAGEREAACLEHNHTKQYLLQEGVPAPFLVKLGVMTPEGKVVKSRHDKFRQINRFLEFIEDIRPVLEREGEIRILDFGCGKSYLTFAMYEYLHNRKGLDVCITGLDQKEDVIRFCNQMAEELGCEKLHFQTGDIAEYEGGEQVDLVVTLHACDTATDYALAQAVRWGARVILSVPCCQHELNGQLRCGMLEPVLKYGILKERMAALITDGLRASMLEEAGYQVQALEFIDMEHTPKNILIRAIRRNTDTAPEASFETPKAGVFASPPEPEASASPEATAFAAPPEPEASASPEATAPASPPEPGALAAPDASSEPPKAGAFAAPQTPPDAASETPPASGPGSVRRLSPELAACMEFLHVRPKLAGLLFPDEARTEAPVIFPAGAAGNPGIVPERPCALPGIVYAHGNGSYDHGRPLRTVRQPGEIPLSDLPGEENGLSEERQVTENI